MFKQKNRRLTILLVVVMLVLPQLFRNNSYIILMLCTAAIYVIAVSGLDVLFGYSGQVSIGHAGFYAIGAYASAILSKTYGVPVLFSMVMAALLATAVAVLVALPAARLVHHFLALITISFGELVYLLVSHTQKLTGGFTGLNFIPDLAIGGFVFGTNYSYYYFVIVVTLFLLLAKARVVSSRTGRAIISVRENVYSSDGIGVNVNKYKTLAFAISAFYTGLAGAMYAHLIGFISPETFRIDQSIIFLTMLLFGGMGNFWGPIVGAVVLTFVTEQLQVLGSYQMLVYGLFLLIVVVYIPSGLTRGLPSARMLLTFAKRPTGAGNNA